MSFKSVLLALLVLSLSGCAVYGGNNGYGQRGYERGHAKSYYHVQRYPVYGAPQYHRQPTYRHDGQRYDHPNPPRYYIPAPQPRHYQTHKYQKGHGYRMTQPHAGWDGRRDRDYSRSYKQDRQPRHDAAHRAERYEDNRRGWERQR
ncbi:hypothetical protein [Pseudomonas sp. TMP25]|uniref:hypothetical protein n=1 Tax=Pseudomonas sp. TMP25 TaxID=3136561 RepID=UPI003100AE31